MEQITKTASSLKEAVWPTHPNQQQTATDTDRAGHADSSAHRAGAAPGGAGSSIAHEVTGDHHDTGRGGKYALNDPASTMKHESGSGIGGTGHHGASDTAEATTGGKFGSSHTPGSGIGHHDTLGTSSTIGKTDNLPASDTASTDEVRSGHVNPFKTSSTTAQPHRDSHTSHASDSSSPLAELHSVDAPPGPTGTAVKISDNEPAGGPAGANPANIGAPRGPSSANEPAGHSFGAKPSGIETANAAPSSTQHAMAGSGPGTAVEPSVGAHPTTENTAQKQQGADRPTEEPGHAFGTPSTDVGHTSHDSASNLSGTTTTSQHVTHEEATHPRHHESESVGSSDPRDNITAQRRKSQPMVAPGKPGDPPSGPPRDTSIQEGTGMKYERSTGLAADGGDFDASRPGAGREADRLLDEAGVYHGKDAGDHKASGEKPSIGERFKEKLHIGTGKQI